MAESKRKQIQNIATSITADKNVKALAEALLILNDSLNEHHAKLKAIDKQLKKLLPPK